MVGLCRHLKGRAPRLGSARLWLALAGLLAQAGCDDQPDRGVTLDFWAMGREGEVVRELTAEFERRNPGIRVRVQQIPWSAAHEKLLTAYAGERCRTSSSSATPGSRSSSRSARCARWTSGSRPRRSVARDDFFAGMIDTNEVEGRLWGVPWYVDTRLLFYRSDLLAAGGLSEPPRDLGQVAGRDGGGQAAAPARTPMRSCCRATNGRRS